MWLSGGAIGLIAVVISRFDEPHHRRLGRASVNDARSSFSTSSG
jgi:hypothetical protein